MEKEIGFLDVFQGLADPRAARNRLYTMSEILLTTLCTAICGSSASPVLRRFRSERSGRSTHPGSIFFGGMAKLEKVRYGSYTKSRIDKNGQSHALNCLFNYGILYNSWLSGTIN